MLSSYSFFRRGWLAASAIDFLPGLDRNADLLAVLRLETNARRLAVLGRDRDLRNVHRCLAALQATLRVRLGRLAVTGGDVHARHDNLAVLGQRLGDVTRLALVLAGQDDDAVTLLDPCSRHHSTSGASEMIFM